MTSPDGLRSCPASPCGVRIPSTMIMCGRHWVIIPADLRRLIGEEYQPGQARQSAAYETALASAIDHVTAAPRPHPTHPAGTARRRPDRRAHGMPDGAVPVDLLADNAAVVLVDNDGIARVQLHACRMTMEQLAEHLHSVADALVAGSGNDQ
ncbi:hypothetical protein [Parafrankia discariae]|uniref:hypothetical protein n=1 Tax=Parafrankia discariae TaxID=365528 RepID=UPI0003A78135|nr:hypothetical protein [Parafrankia discariae]